MPYSGLVEKGEFACQALGRLSYPQRAIDRFSVSICLLERNKLTDLLSVMEDLSVRVQGEVLYGYNHRGIPATGLGPMYFDHVVRAMMTEDQFIPRRLNCALLGL